MNVIKDALLVCLYLMNVENVKVIDYYMKVIVYVLKVLRMMEFLKTVLI